MRVEFTPGKLAGMKAVSDDRGVIAAAAITPRESDTAFIPASFPGVNFTIVSPLCKRSFYNGNEKSCRTAPSTARAIISSSGSVDSACSTSRCRAFVAGCLGVKSVQQSWSGMIEIG